MTPDSGVVDKIAELAGGMSDAQKAELAKVIAAPVSQPQPVSAVENLKKAARQADNRNRPKKKSSAQANVTKYGGPIGRAFVGKDAASTGLGRVQELEKMFPGIWMDDKVTFRHSVKIIDPVSGKEEKRQYIYFHGPNGPKQIGLKNLDLAIDLGWTYLDTPKKHLLPGCKDWADCVNKLASIGYGFMSTGIATSSDGFRPRGISNGVAAALKSEAAKEEESAI